MLALIFALAATDPAAAAPAPAPAAAPAAKVSKQDRVTCKWVTNGGGISQHICLTAREWRNDQIEWQRRVDDFQRRALTTSPRG
jgi:hypothetical protein